MARSNAAGTTLDDVLRREYSQVRESHRHEGASHVLVQQDARTLAVLLEWQLQRVASAFFHGIYYKGTPPVEEKARHDLLVRAYQTTLWHAIIVSLSRGWDYERLNWAHWLSYGFGHLQDLPRDNYVPTLLFSRCARLLEELALLPRHSTYRVASALRELVYLLGCLGGALGITEREPIDELRAQQKTQAPATRKHQRERWTQAVADAKRACERLFCGNRTPVIEFLGQNLPGTLGHLCVALGEKRVNLLKSHSRTITLDGHDAMQYMAWVQLPEATSATDVVSSLFRDESLHGVLFVEPTIRRENATDEEWSSLVQDLDTTSECHRVYINGNEQIKTNTEVEQLRLEQEQEGTYSILYDGPNSCYYVHKSRYATSGTDERALVQYFAHAGGGFRCTREMRQKKWHITNPPKTFERCCSRLAGVVSPVRSKDKKKTAGWWVEGPTCRIPPVEQV